MCAVRATTTEAPSTMLQQPLLEQLRALKLFGMAEALAQQLAQPQTHYLAG